VVVTVVLANCLVQFPDGGFIALEHLREPVAGNEQSAGNVLAFVA
jgi:hypothetical protein